MRKVYAALGVLFAVGAFAGWWIADQIDGITNWDLGDKGEDASEEPPIVLASGGIYGAGGGGGGGGSTLGDGRGGSTALSIWDIK